MCLYVDHPTHVTCTAPQGRAHDVLLGQLLGKHPDVIMPLMLALYVENDALQSPMISESGMRCEAGIVYDTIASKSSPDAVILDICWRCHSAIYLRPNKHVHFE
jgi:hypothetical protein